MNLNELNEAYTSELGVGGSMPSARARFLNLKPHDEPQDSPRIRAKIGDSRRQGVRP